MTIDLDALERIAQAATPGPWDHQPYGEQNQNGDYFGGDVFDGNGEYLLSEVADVDGAHIAAFDPPAALALITRVRELEAIVNDGGNQAAKYWTRLAEAEREMHARELHHFEEEKLRAAFAVFEQAHTPSDDELRAEVERVQKAAWAEIHGQDPMRKYSVAEVKQLVYSFDNVLCSLLARRTVQGEPSATCPKCEVVATDQTPSTFYTHHDETCGGPLEEPQGEPTDAIRAALDYIEVIGRDMPDDAALARVRSILKGERTS